MQMLLKSDFSKVKYEILTEDVKCDKSFIK
jgi:hypothetical protein